MQFVQVFKGVEKCFGDRLHLLVLGEHQRQLLLKHQHTRRHCCHDYIASLNCLVKRWDVFLHKFLDGLEVAELEFWHAAAMFARSEVDPDTIVLEHFNDAIGYRRFVVIAIAGREQGDAFVHGRVRSLILDGFVRGLLRIENERTMCFPRRLAGVGGNLASL